MNHIYKVVLNKSTGLFVAVPEFAKAQGKSSRMKLLAMSIMSLSTTLGSAGAFAGSSVQGSFNHVAVDGSAVQGNYHVIAGQGSQITVIGSSNTVDANISRGNETVDGTPFISFTSVGSLTENSRNSVVLGVSNTVNKSASSVAIGRGINLDSVDRAVAIGLRTDVTQKDGLALGSYSVADRAGFTASDTNGAQITGMAANQVYAANNLSSNDKASILATANNTLGAVSVGNNDRNRQITNVAAGSLDDDAVNVAQLRAVANTLLAKPQNYFHVNGSNNVATTSNLTNLDAVDGIGGAKGGRALAAGVNAQAMGQNSVAVGFGATIKESAAYATQQSSNSIAMGTDANVDGQKSVAIGHKAAVAAPQYNEASGVAIGDEAEVKAKNSIAIGYKAKANDDNHAGPATSQGSALSLGDQSEATNNYALALGTTAKANGYAALAMSYNANALSKNSIALGESSKAGSAINTGYGEVAIGNKAQAVGERALAIGIQSKSLADRSTTIGMSSEATAAATRSTAVGFAAKTEGVRSAAFGDTANAKGVDSTAIGTGAVTQAAAQNAYAIGRGANANGISSFAVGTNSATKANQAFAIGTSSVANTAYAIAMGNEAVAGTTATQGYRAIGIGHKAQATANDSIAMGYGAQAINVTSTSIGRNAINSGSSSIAVGDNVKVSADRAVAIGRNIEVTQAENVVLGSWSSEKSATITTAGVVPEINQATVGSTTYGRFSGMRSVGVVSIGRDAADNVGGDGKDGERRLINVGAGEISARSTDAINGSQLFAVANSIPATYTTTSGEPLVKIGDEFYKPSDVPADGSAPNVANAVAPADVMVSMISPDANKTVNAPTTLANVASNLSPTTSGTTLIDADGNKITVGVQPTTVVQAPTVDEQAAMNNKAATAGDVLNSGWNLKHSDGKATSPTITDKDFVRHADNVVFANGNGTIASIETDGTTNTIKYDVNVDGKTIKINTNGQLYADVTDTNTVTSVINSSTTTVTPDTTNAAAPTYKVEVNKATVATTPTNTASNTDITVNTSGKVVAPTTAANKDNHFVTAQGLADVVNDSGFTLKTSANGGTKVSGNDEVINPGETVEMAAGKNLTVKQEANGKITFATAENVAFTTVTTGDTVMNGNGITINNGAAGNPVSITKNGVDNGGNKITNVAAGVNDTDAVNVSQLKSLVAGVKTKVEAGNNMEVSSVVDVASGETTYTVATAADVKFDSVQYGDNGPKITNVGNNIKVADQNGNATKITNVAPGDISATSTDAVNGSQIYALNGGQVNNVTNVTVTNPDGSTIVVNNVIVDASGKPLLKTYNVEGQTEYITNNVVTAINNMNEQGIKFFHVNDGQNYTTQGMNTIDSSASGTHSAAIGYQAAASGERSVALGKGAQATGIESISIGTGNKVHANHAGAFGDPNVVNVGADGSYVVGNHNTVSTASTFVLGSNVSQTTANSVFLGDNAASFAQAGSNHNAATGAHEAQGHAASAYTYLALNDANVAGKTANGVVSVGNATEVRQVQGVAAGVVSPTSTDAINGSQLYDTHRAINQTYNYINDVDERASAGIASAMATANLPQVYMPGKSMVAAGVGYYRGEPALAIGGSTISDNGKWIIKGTANINRRDVGGSVGVGYQW